MHLCPECNSNMLQKRGRKYRKLTDTHIQQYKCNDCGKRFNVEIDTTEPEKISNHLTQNKKYVFTYYEKGTEVNEKFLETLVGYCEINSAELVVLTQSYDQEDLDEDGDLYALNQVATLCSSNIDVAGMINVYATLKIGKTSGNPLYGLEGLTKGKSLIVGHATLQMGTLPVFGDSHPIMMHTTGTISIPQYNEQHKSGAKALHNHSYSALVVELDVDNNLFHIRVLNADDDGTFNDLDVKYYYNDNTGDAEWEYEGVEALIFGDTHATVADKDVTDATFFNTDCIVATLRPRVLVHHDLLDFGLLQSHHNKNSFFKRYKKFIDGKDNVLTELSATANYLLSTIPSFVEDVLIVSSNHNDHLTQYLDGADVKHDYKNAKLYHYLVYKVLSAMEAGHEVNPFKFFIEEFYKDNEKLEKIKFLEREDVYYIKDILISTHGDKGTGGSMFSPVQGKNYSTKIIVGHSHSPSINEGCYRTGTMTGKLDYTIGTPSSWMNTHCVIYKSGKRQLISVIKGKWRLD